MAEIVGVRFKNAGKLYYFDPGNLWPAAGDFVVVETARGLEYGQVITGVRSVSEESLVTPLKPVVRIATRQDMQHAQDNAAFEKEAYGICQKKIDEHKLDMKLVGVEQTFDNSKILFYFTANGRVDFRALVKDLATVFHTRIELRQIGVRDEARMLGGLGPCGRPICCGSFLGDFQPVSIKMAKEQNLSLNPTKISGVCGRLMCCLKFEEDHYENTSRRMPRIGREVDTPEGRGTVVDLNILKETVSVRIGKGDTFEQKIFPLEDVHWKRPHHEAEEKPEMEDIPAEAQELEKEDVPAIQQDNRRSEQQESRPSRRERRAQNAAEKGAEKFAEKGALKAAEKPAPETAPAYPTPAVAPAAKQVPEKPAANDWRSAVEAALKAKK